MKIYSESQGRWDIKIGEWIEIDSKNSDRESIFKILKDVKEKDIYYKDEQCTVDSTKDISKNLNLNNESKDLNITTINDIKNEIIVDYSLNEIKENKNLLREYTFIMKVKQVPFVDSSQIIKTQQITRNKSGFSFSSTTISKGVPYCDYFSFDETWDVQPILDNNKQEATILRIMYHVNFFKSTLFANTINLRSKEEYNKDIDNWKEWMSSKGINISSFNSFKSKQIKSTVLSHGLAKDNFDPYQEEYKNMLLKKKTTIEKIKEFFNFKTFHNKISNLLTIIKNNISGKDFVIFAMLGIVLYQSYIMNSRLDNFAK